MTIVGFLVLAMTVTLLIIDGILSRGSGLRFKFASLMLFFLGSLLIFGDRVTRVDIGIFHFEQVTAKAVSDATAISGLRTRVENQSATVDLVAQKASVAEQVSNEAQDQIKEAKKSLDDLKGTIAEAKESLEKVQAVASLTELIADAQNDDRLAFDELRKIANNPNNPLAQRADGAWRSISTSFASAIQLEFQVPWARGVDPSKFKMWDLEIA